MDLLVQREPSTLTSTPGTLSVNGSFECFTLEDLVREVHGQPVATWKVADKTAIPVGTYTVTIDFSNRFQRSMPLIKDVSGFDGIRIHSGNTAADTDGCILLGTTRSGPDNVSGSRDAYAGFFPKLQAAISRREPVTITIAAARPLATTQRA